jgi:hypothetical protein
VIRLINRNLEANDKYPNLVSSQEYSCIYLEKDSTIIIKEISNSVILNIVFENENDPVGIHFLIRFDKLPSIEDFKKIVADHIRCHGKVGERLLDENCIWILGYNDRHRGFLENFYEMIERNQLAVSLEGNILI